MEHKTKVGLAVVGCVGVCLGALYAQAPRDAGRDPMSSSRRFEIVQSSLAAKWQYLLDTHTGDIWGLVDVANKGGREGSEMAWVKMPRIDTPH